MFSVGKSVEKIKIPLHWKFHHLEFLYLSTVSLLCKNPHPSHTAALGWKVWFNSKKYFYLFFCVRIFHNLVEFGFVESRKEQIIGNPKLRTERRTLSRTWGTCCRGWTSRISARSCHPSRWCTMQCGGDCRQSTPTFQMLTMNCEWKCLLTWLASTYLELDSSAFFFSRDLVVNSAKNIS